MSDKDKAYVKAAHAASTAVAQMAAVTCNHVVDGRPCRRCNAVAAGVVCGMGLFPVENFRDFLESFTTMYNKTAAKFGLSPIAGVGLNEIVLKPAPLDPERN